MKICILAEGSYPYVVGGVSSWIQMLIKGMPEHEFIIYSIGAESKMRGKFKYEFPKNLTFVHEVFLDEILNFKSKKQVNIKFTKEEKDFLYNLISGSNELDINALISLLHQKNQYNFLDIFMCHDFYDALYKAYIDKFPYLPFTDFFWTIRSMLLPLFFIIQEGLPKADLYHSVAAGYCGVIGAIGKILYNKPFLLTEHGIYSREREEEILKCDWVEGDFKEVWIKYFYGLSNISYTYSDCVTTLSNVNKEAELSLGCDENKILIIPNGVFLERFKDVSSNGNHPFTLGAIIRVVPIKDILTMIRSFALVQQEIPDAKLILMGGYEESPEYFLACKNTIKNLNLKNVIFTGAVDIVKYLSDIDVLLLTSISEGLPLSILEGMAAKKPYISTDVGCCREILLGDSNDDLGEAGIITAVMDFRAIANASLKLAKNPSLRHKMGEIGYKRVEKYYTYDLFINSFKALYKNFQVKKERTK